MKTNCKVQGDCPFCEAENPYKGSVHKTQGILLRDPGKSLFDEIKQALNEGKKLYLRVAKRS